MKAIIALLVIALVVVIASCSHAPRLARESSETAAFRAQYLESNPDSPFNRHIERGEVTRGMGVMEVLASWGVPDRRQSVTQCNVEFWTYITYDDYRNTYTSYDLVFDARTLDRWVRTEDVASYEDLVQRDLTALYGRSTGTGSIATGRTSLVGNGPIQK